MRKLHIGLIMAMLIMLPAIIQAAELKLGVVNLQKALNECQAGKEAVAELEDEVKKRQEQVDARQEELKKLNEEAEKKRSVWSDEMKEQKQREVQARMQEFQRFYMQSNDDLKKRNFEKARTFGEMGMALNPDYKKLHLTMDYIDPNEKKSRPKCYQRRRHVVTDFAFFDPTSGKEYGLKERLNAYLSKA